MKTTLPSFFSRETEPFRSLQREVERVFHDFGRLPGVFGKGEMPAMNVAENTDGVEVTAELPGCAEEDIDVTLVGDVLTIKGEKKVETEDKKNDYHVFERAYGSFRRDVSLPFAAEPDKVTATFDKGVLKVVIPRPAEVVGKTARIAIGKA